jgi:hypothetical protein
MTKEEKEKEPKRELTDIRPDKVSLVDLGANNEKFFIAKGLKVKESGEATDLAKAVESYLGGITSRVNTLCAWLEKADVDNEHGVIPQQVTSLLNGASDSIQDVKLAFTDDGALEDVSIPGPIRDKMVLMLEVVTSKVAKASEEIMKSDEITENFMSSLDDIDVAISAIEDSYVGLEMAVWSRAYINDLPDSAFLYIAPGGEKDDDGKTKPRSLRKFPYKNKNGNVDLPHLRNAIARIPQSKLSDDLKDKLQAKARKILAANTKKQASEETMRDQIAALLKSADAPQPELDIDNVKKQAEDAISTLKDVISMLEVDTKRVDELWDLRWKIGDAISMLIDAAALDAILGPFEEISDSLGEDRDEKETEMSKEKTEGKSVEEEAVKSSDSSENAKEPEVEVEKKTDAEEKEEPTEKAKKKPAPAEDVTAETSASDKLADTIANAVTEAMAPVREAVDTLQEAVQKQAEQIEKLDNDRAVAKGASTPDETQGNTDDGGESEPKSVFSPLMPSHLQGKYAHGEKVED